ncbi:glycerol-3-phosphate acyltransferase 9-like [Rosa chinensis]|uniref:glycerol-3-phosphate acyltransferase 9-like n=1 Tax=Rosa chinensis TaxID=74649 RepID=UPI001AD8F662|nr:glycerol-3-phosphate acyltransferase 9-like [Rosa chinensis]
MYLVQSFRIKGLGNCCEEVSINRKSMLDFCIKLLPMLVYELVQFYLFFRLRDHVVGPDNNPFLIFPEGTCVNNHYTVMFKKGAFELGCSVCPVAIRYNKIFVDAFWNSRKQSFTMHLLQLMISWAVVCDVWYLEPENMKPGETAIEFAEVTSLSWACIKNKVPCLRSV